MNILIVEDDIISQNIILDCLSEYKCSLASNGIEAVEMFRLALDQNNPYYLICMDIILPDLDGYESMKKIRAIEKEYNVPKEKSVKVIITTIVNDSKNLKKGFDLNCDAYAGKPINKKQLINTIKSLSML